MSGEWEHHWFMEVDLSTEGSAALMRKLRLYLDYWRTGIEQAERGTFPLVLWLTSTERQETRLRLLIDALPESERRLFLVARLGREVHSIKDVESTTGVDSVNDSEV